MTLVLKRPFPLSSSIIVAHLLNTLGSLQQVKEINE